VKRSVAVSAPRWRGVGNGGLILLRPSVLARGVFSALAALVFATGDPDEAPGCPDQAHELCEGYLHLHGKEHGGDEQRKRNDGCKQPLPTADGVVNWWPIQCEAPSTRRPACSRRGLGRPTPAAARVTAPSRSTPPAQLRDAPSANRKSHHSSQPKGRPGASSIGPYSSAQPTFKLACV
jgi:hypothetical protein